MENELLACRKCRRLSNQLIRLRESHPDYWNQPVPATGCEDARLVIVGLAPGLHGANRTGVPFTGDASGDLLFKVLKRHHLEDKVRITNVVKCLPVKNLPSAREVVNCSKFLSHEVVHAAHQVFLVLGGVAHRAVIRALGLKQKDFPFGHGLVHNCADVILIDSYHCSRYNTQTGRLTEAMFTDVVGKAKSLAFS